MKLMSFRRPDGTPSWGIVKGEGVIDLGNRAPSLKHALWAMTSLAEEAMRHADYALADITFLKNRRARGIKLAVGGVSKESEFSWARVHI